MIKICYGVLQGRSIMPQYKIKEKNYPEAVGLFKLAADKGDVSAYFQLGFCYAFGKGVKRSSRKSERLIKAGKKLVQLQCEISRYWIKN
jgi:TPR repeat protein